MLECFARSRICGDGVPPPVYSRVHPPLPPKMWFNKMVGSGRAELSRRTRTRTRTGGLPGTNRRRRNGQHRAS